MIKSPKYYLIMEEKKVSKALPIEDNPTVIRPEPPGKDIPVRIREGLTIYVKAGTDIELIKKRYKDK